jgi:hypothetical protein
LIEGKNMVKKEELFSFFFEKKEVTEDEFVEKFGKGNYAEILEKYVEDLQSFGLDYEMIKNKETGKTHFILIIPNKVPDLPPTETAVFLFLSYMIIKKKGMIGFNDAKNRLIDYDQAFETLVTTHKLFKAMKDGDIYFTPAGKALLIKVEDEFEPMMDKALGYNQ